ncbi:MAG: uracil phosphoribosyltransferase [Pseudanabaenaceae cyanobacterium bins.39]|nr:uracil phosphoribosyltransferase [Pseudanabaenaceae cyanobacterium bins.39]
MASQLRIYVPPHPLIRHWLTIAREKHTPVPLFRTAMQEMGKWLTYEAMRDIMPLQEVNVETPLGQAAGSIIDSSITIALVPILRAGLSMLEGCQGLLPAANVYHLGLVRNEETLEASCYLDRLPKQFDPQTIILIVEPMMATGGSIITTLKLLTERGADPTKIRIINALCAPPALQLINQQFPSIQVYSACIDEVVNEKGWIVPGLGDAGDRSFGTFD